MPNNTVSDWPTDPATITEVGGVELRENLMLPSNVNNAIRTVMSQVASGITAGAFVSQYHAATAAVAASLDFAEVTVNGTNKATIIAPAAMAANQTLTLPDATDTLVGKATTDTLTNKTLTDPAIIGTVLEDIYTLTDGVAFEIDPGNGSIQQITLTASRTPAATNFANGEGILLMINDGTAYTITWTTIAVTWIGGAAPTLATTGWTHIVLYKVGGTIYGRHVGDSA